MAGRSGLYAIGPIDGLDGEVTIFDSNAYISKVRGESYIMDHTLNHGAIFLVWTEQKAWKDIEVPPKVKNYLDLQHFIKQRAGLAGIDVAKPFAFLISGTPREIQWHINVDWSERKPITRELFSKSKQGYILASEPVDIVGFYSDGHAGEFISQFAPAIKEGSGAQNHIHLHLVAKNGRAAGHIDDIKLGEHMVLRLPQPSCR